MNFLEWGKRSDNLLVLVHGFLDHARSWEPLVAAMQKSAQRDFWIVAPDCRGHGDSGWVGAGGYYHFPDYVQDLHAIIERMDISAVNLVGHSMGGTISFLYAGTFPERVSKLMLIEGIGPMGMRFSDAPGRMGQWISEVNILRQKKLHEYSSPEEAARGLQRKNPRMSHDSVVQWARSGMRRTDNGKWIWKFDPLHRTTAPQPFYSGQAIEFFRRITCPVMLVQGKESRQARRPDTQQRWEAIADRQAVEIEAAGHMVQRDNPEALAEAVMEFFYR